MTDKVFQKQLESFGIESVRIKHDEPKKQDNADGIQNTFSVIKALMDEMKGRQWLYSLLDMCQTFTPSFVPGKPDVSDFCSGIQSVGLKLYGDIMAASPENFYIMLQEEGARKQVEKEKAE